MRWEKEGGGNNKSRWVSGRRIERSQLNYYKGYGGVCKTDGEAKREVLIS